MEKVGPAAPQQQPQPQPEPEPQPQPRTHPFIHELKLSTAQRIRALVLGAVLCPLRLALASLCFALMWPLARLRLLGLTAAERSRPVEGWRHWLLHPLMLLLSRASFLCLGFLWVEVKGRRAHLKEAPVLVVAPHSSFLDMMVLCHSQLATVVSRSENTSIPVIGALLEFNQSVLVSRKDPESRKQAVAQLSERLTSNGYWPQMLMFPEGTTTNGQALIQFKPGAFLSGVPVQPVLLRYPNELDTVRWTYKGTSWWEVLWYTSSQLYTKMTIEFLPVYKPSQEERDDPNLYAHNVQKIMAEALGVPATDYVMEGGVPVSKVGGLSLPLESPARETLALLRRDGLAASEVEEALARVIEKCRVLGGQGSKVGAEELAATLGLADGRTARDICGLYSRDGMLELRQLYLSVSAVAGFVSFRSLLRTAFTLFDGQGGGSLRQEELRDLMGALLGLPQHTVAQLHAEARGSSDGSDGSDGRLTQEALLKVLTSHPTFGRVASEHLWPQGAESGLLASSRTAADNNGNVTHGRDSAHGKKRQ